MHTSRDTTTVHFKTSQLHGTFLRKVKGTVPQTTDVNKRRKLHNVQIVFGMHVLFVCCTIGSFAARPDRDLMIFAEKIALR